MQGRRRAVWTLLAASLTVFTPFVPQASAAGARYVSGGTAAVRADGQTVVDEGTVVCDNGNGIGAGGFCVPFGGGNAIEVIDDTAGDEVAFQVCIDNSGDGVCTSPDFGPCGDVVVFSHDDAGNFFNPVGPVPTGFASGCSGGPWKGYVVLICDGVHAAGSSGHAHPVSSGVGAVVSGGEGMGNFCGGSPIQQSRKPYKLGSGARYVSGATAVSRNNGETTADEGIMQCNGGDNTGVGGFCTSFGGGDAMAVFDEAAGRDVPFQVCIDNSGDGVCTSPDFGTCADRIYFSHDDNGAFYNPLGPIATGFDTGCGNGAWDGYVVFLCEGTHTDGLSPHAHAATSGTGRVTSGGEGLGTFCGGSHEQPSRKPYMLDPRTPPLGVFTSDGPCRLAAAGNENVTGGQDTVTGQLSGQFVSTNPRGTVSLTCFVRVDGTTVASTQTGSGVGAATTTGQVTFTASDTQDVDVCAEVTENGSTSTTCGEVEQLQAPPQVVLDVLDQVVALLADAAAPFGQVTCAVLADQGVPGIVNLTTPTTRLSMDVDDCDVRFQGTRRVDFVPFED